MKKTALILVCLAMALLLCGPGLTEDEDEPYMWSEPGLRYIVNELAPQREIHDEKEAEAYAEELWSLLSDSPIPEGTKEMLFDQHDRSYHFSINNEDNMALYNAGFLSNGVIQHISVTDTDPERYSGTRKDGTELDAETWEKAKEQITAWVEKVSPGILKLVEPLTAYSVLDNGKTMRLFVAAMPLDAELAGSINIVAILYPDGRCEIIDYSCYGAG